MLRQKSLKQKPSEMLCLWGNSITSYLLTPGVAFLFGSRNSALLEKQSRKIGEQLCKGGGWDGMFLFAEGQRKVSPGREGIRNGRGRVSAPESQVGLSAGQGPRCCPSSELCPAEAGAPVFGICQMPHAWQ